jgi:hypothetical protein
METLLANNVVDGDSRLVDIVEESERIIQILHDNGGELPPDLEADFNVAQAAAKEKFDRYLLVIRMFEGRVAFAKEEAARYVDLAKSYQARIDGLCFITLRSMKRLDIDKSEGEHGILTRVKGREVIDEIDGKKISKEFVETIPQPDVTKIDKKVIMAAIKAGRIKDGEKFAIEGVTLKRNPDTLKIK